MIVQTGIDVIEVERIKDAIETGKEHFLNRIYTPNEIAYCESKNTNKYQHYAARFAAKEAVFKAISNQIRKRGDAVWNQIEVLQKPDGRPYINEEKLAIQNLEQIDISLTHLEKLAMASVVVKIREKGETNEVI